MKALSDDGPMFCLPLINSCEKKVVQEIFQRKTENDWEVRPNINSKIRFMKKCSETKKLLIFYAVQGD